MTYAQVIAQIEQFIITNGNNEITAAILNPILKNLAGFANDSIGDLSDLTTSENTNLVSAINEINEALGSINAGGIQLYSGTADPNDTPPVIFSTGDFYLQVDGSENPLMLYQYDGTEWATREDQDNIDIRKTFYFETGSTISQILSIINNLPAYTVNEKQSVWFVAIENSGFLQDPLVYKYKLMNKGKGTYGSGATQLLSTDLELLFISPITEQDIENAPNTDLIPYGAITSPTDISDWLNAENPAIPIQAQTDGYTLFKGTVDGVQKDYLWIGAAGDYGVGGLTSTMANFQLLESGAPLPTVPSWQDTLEVDNGSTIAPVVVDEVTGEKTEYLGTGLSNTKEDVVTTVEFEQNTVGTKWVHPAKDGGVHKYASEDYVDDIAATKADLVSGKVPASQLPSFVDDVLEYADLASFPAIGEDGKLYVALDTNLVYRWSGSTYVEISPTVIPSFQQVTDVDFVTTNPIISESNIQGESISVYDNLAEQAGTINASNLTEVRNYELPDYSGTFALQESNIKTISATTYTLLDEDAGKVLHFTSSTSVTVTIPTGLATNKRYEGVQLGDGQVSFVTDGTTLRVGASETATTAEKYSVFGLDWIGTNEYLLYGKLELA